MQISHAKIMVDFYVAVQYNYINSVVEQGQAR